MRRYALQVAARELLPGERRLHGCHRWMVAPTVQLLHLPQFRAGAFGGLQHCGCLWQCPVCSAKISERRRWELHGGTEAWSGQGGEILLVTLTVRHKRADDLRETLDAMLKARRRMLSGKAAAKFNARFGVAGRIRVLEVTHGEVNGWHPHMHELVFVEAGCDREAFLAEYRRRWGQAVQGAGLRDVNDHGVDVQFSDLSVADYISKFGRERQWGPEEELAKTISKEGKLGARNPLGLLSDYLEKGDGRAGELWREYAVVFKGRRQLSWSDGLRELLGLQPEQSDQELVEEQREDAALLDELSKPEWQAVLGNDARGELLEVLGRGSVAELREFLAVLGIERQPEGGGLLSSGDGARGGFSGLCGPSGCISGGGGEDYAKQADLPVTCLGAREEVGVSWECRFCGVKIYPGSDPLGVAGDAGVACHKHRKLRCDYCMERFATQTVICWLEYDKDFTKHRICDECVEKVERPEDPEDTDGATETEVSERL